MSKTKDEHPMYDPWLVGIRSRKKQPTRISGGRESGRNQEDQAPRRSWGDIIKEVKESKERVPNMEEAQEGNRDVNEHHNVENNEHKMEEVDGMVESCLRPMHQEGSWQQPNPA